MHIYKNTSEEQIFITLLPEAEAMGYDIVRVQLRRSKRGHSLQIMIERLDGAPIQLEDCEKASKAFGALLDVANILAAEYSLEISSVGLNRPLTRKKDYLKNVGQKIKITTLLTIDGTKFFEGIIQSCNDEGIELALNKNKAIIQIKFDAIKQATLVTY